MVYTRKNQNALTATEKRRFVNAVLALKRTGEYDEFVRIHITYYVSDGEPGLRVAHMTPSFLPWHRRYLLEFERALQRVDSSVTVPYWDWTVDRSRTSSLWAADFLGGNGRDGDRRVTTGPFAYRQGNWTLRENVTDDPFLVRDLGYPAQPIALPTKAELAVATRQKTFDAAPWNSTSASGFRNKLEGWGSGSGNAQYQLHNRVHRWVGGQMLGGSSPNDPVFWLHHAMIDRVWSSWQKAHPGAAYLPATPPGRNSSQYRRIVARNEAMPPWNVKPSQLEDHSKIYRYA
ncbi:tyrosinase [Streptomyces sulfonofaciens]|uniref:Tyrosinase n=1 Tax=Streptomyces sulfonofaciens TaxID=68272 RepID=A0A919FPI8_9ACTN|nr:tyrosinase family protein [Streptomyces sulfonofaciens]GHH69285.1 tyrosinase [Streptomyces sulfonofaciens]